MTSPHAARLGPDLLPVSDGQSVGELLDSVSRRKAESWMAALLQVEHLALLVGNGLPTGVGFLSGTPPPPMGQDLDAGERTEAIRSHAMAAAQRIGRDSNIEDQIRSALALADGYEVLGDTDARQSVLDAVNAAMSQLIADVLEFERHLDSGVSNGEAGAIHAIREMQRFLLPLATRSTGRHRLSIFTTNYDRLIEYSADAIGLHIIDRFVGTMQPIFNASRLDVDLHYSPPGLRGEPRYLDGVVRLAKLHGSLDWRVSDRDIVRVPLPFGAAPNHPEIPNDPSGSVLIYPNPAKSVETLAHPYAELFRDLAATICRPNAVLITFGYGFGDSHINRVISDMLSIPSTHLVVSSFSEGNALKTFRDQRYPTNQTTELLGPVLGSITGFTELLPSIPMLDLYGRQAEYANLRDRIDGHADDQEN